MKYNIIGKVHFVGELNKVSEKFTKKELILVVDGTYPQYIKIDFCQDKISKLESVKIGDTVSVDFFLNGRLWKDTCFNSLNGFSISLAVEPAKELEEEENNLPF